MFEEGCEGLLNTVQVEVEGVCMWKVAIALSGVLHWIKGNEETQFVQGKNWKLMPLERMGNTGELSLC